jgi:hypothetical protein
MSRILDLQKLESTTPVDEAAAASTSSWIGCSCSTHSNSGCTPVTVTVAI